MERSSGKLVDLTLVSKYYPVANYSYPRKGSITTTTTPNTTSRSYSRCSSNTSSCGRESLGSEGSAPGLIEDRTDSEVSLDDDYQYHTHMSELWDSFWPHRSSSKADEASSMVPTKHYPALIPSPNRKKQQPLIHGRQEPPSWPLPNGHLSPPPCSPPPSTERPRKAAATYSAFPKPVSQPPTRSLPPIPARKKSQKQLQSNPQLPHTNDKPLRPPRPAETLLTPCIQQPGFVPVNFAMVDYTIHNGADSPISPTNPRRPSTSTQDQPSPSSDSFEDGCSNRRSQSTIYSVISHSASHLPIPEIRRSPKAPRHYKSIAAISACPVEQEPHSVFEEDSDDEEEDHGKKFFSFHKRSESDHKRRRNRSYTTVSPVPTEDEALPLSAQQRRHGHDVFGRILGRRSR
ncbi:hypothetical protein QQS21_002995 [Conoideocrella luteorostrata]|uniref:Uncharacterized protein n=1 Tax=Conoideocrella luteorostrata TaxID=1105319 RepID=A0AAJ0CX31_9HYPO|nr:hypothetical protein QQS21_002995 [Conoideocrella luteorostrata]